MIKTLLENDYLKILFDESTDFGYIELIAKDKNSTAQGNVQLVLNPEDGAYLSINGVPKFTFGANGGEISANDVNCTGNRFEVRNLFTTPASSVPSSSTDTGVVGDTRFDDMYIYRCYETDKWIRFEKDGTAW